MKTIYLLILLIAPSINFVNAGTAPVDTSKHVASYTLSSRNNVAAEGKYKKLNITLTHQPNTNQYVVDIECERDINAYLEISDQEENVIFFKQVHIRSGNDRITFEAEDGHQSLFRLAFQEDGKPAVFIIREGADASEAITTR